MFDSTTYRMPVVCFFTFHALKDITCIDTTITQAADYTLNQ